MKTRLASKKSENSHNNPTFGPPAPTAPNPPIHKSIDPTIHPSPPSIHSSNNPPLPPFPPSILKRKFRALSFGAQLTETQRAVLSSWLTNEEYSVEDIRKKVAAPPPDGFGMEVNSTTLFRLRKLADNTRAATWISDAMDTACDILENEDVGENAPIHQALTSLLYSRALHAAQKQAMPETIDKIVTTIAKLEKLKNCSSRASRPSRALTTRHHVELSIIPQNYGKDASSSSIVQFSTSKVSASAAAPCAQTA